MRRHEAEGRTAAARLLTALAILLPAALARVGAGERGGSSRVTLGAGAGAAAEPVARATGFRAGGRRGLLLDAFSLRKLQTEGIDECTESTSVGDAEAGIAIYYDEEACDRVDPMVGCNGE